MRCMPTVIISKNGMSVSSLGFKGKLFYTFQQEHVLSLGFKLTSCACLRSLHNLNLYLDKNLYKDSVTAWFLLM